MRNKAKILVLIILVLIFATIWYKYPYEINKSFTASTIYGTTSRITINMKGYRNLFGPTEYVGQFKVNQEIYKTYKVERASDDFWEKLNKKMGGVKYYPMLLIDNQNGLEVNNDVVNIIWADKKINTLYFSLNKYGEDFFAPANDAIEAKELQKKVFSILLK